jgi:hypothetical protein
MEGGMTAEDYSTPPRVVGRDAVFVRHRLKSPQVADSAYIATTAVLCGDVTVGPHSRVLFGAVVTAEGGPVEIGANAWSWRTRSSAVCRSIPPNSATACSSARMRHATGAVVFNGACLERGAQVEFHAIVYVKTVVPAGVAVPMKLVRGRQPGRARSARRVGPDPRVDGPPRLCGHGFGSPAATLWSPTSPAATPAAWPCTSATRSYPPVSITGWTTARRPPRLPVWAAGV